MEREPSPLVNLNFISERRSSFSSDFSFSISSLLSLSVLAATVAFLYLIMTPVVSRPNITVVIKNIKVVITKGLVFFDFIVHHLYNN